MGNGSGPIDDGTLARIALQQSQARSGSTRKSGSKQAQPSMAERIVSYAQRNRGGRVGDGQCDTLVNRALGPEVLRLQRTTARSRPMQITFGRHRSRWPSCSREM